MPTPTLANLERRWRDLHTAREALDVQIIELMAEVRKLRQFRQQITRQTPPAEITAADRDLGILTRQIKLLEVQRETTARTENEASIAYHAAAAVVEQARKNLAALDSDDYKTFLPNLLPGDLANQRKRNQAVLKKCGCSIA